LLYLQLAVYRLVVFAVGCVSPCCTCSWLCIALLYLQLAVYHLVVFAHKEIMYYQAEVKLLVLFGELIDLLLKLRSLMQ